MAGEATATVTNINERAKTAVRSNFNKQVFWSVIAAGAAISLTVYGLRKVGLKKAASIAAKAK